MSVDEHNIGDIKPAGSLDGVMNLWGKEAFTNLQPQLFKFLVWKAPARLIMPARIY